MFKIDTIDILLLRDRIVIDETDELITVLETNNISYCYEDGYLIIKNYDNIYKALYYLNENFNIILN